MPAVRSSTVAKTDYTDVNAVIALAKRFGKGMTVYKHPGRQNYNITHTSRRDLWAIPGAVVAYQS